MIVSAMFTSLTGLKAAERQVEASSANIANMRTAANLEDAQAEARLQTQGTADPGQASGFEGFKPVRVDQHSLAGGGVRAEFRNDPNFFVTGYDPGSPVADADGLVALPNVNSATEIVNLNLARTAYSANLAAIRTEDEMLGELLNKRA